MAKTRSLLLQERMTVAVPDGKFWGTAATNAAELSSMYMIGLVDIQTLKSIQLPGSLNLDPRGKYRKSTLADGAWFQFPTPPRQYEIAENAATTITPTQGGGKFIESHGNIFKEIRISGTVGFRPNPTSVDQGALGKIGQATGVSLTVPSTVNQFLKDERGLDPKEATGFDDIMFLRNIFRLYFDLKKNNEYARRVVMVWRYVKESEVYIVEPLNFTTTRDSSSPLSYAYNITLRTLYRFDTQLKKPKDSLSTFSSIAAGIASVKQAVRDVAVALEQLGSAIDFVTQLPFRVADQLVTDALSVMAGLANLATLGARLEKVGQKFLDRMADRAKEMRTYAAQIESRRIEGNKPSAFESSPTPAVPGVPGIPLISVDAALAILRNAAIRAGYALERVALRVRAQDALFQKPRQIQVTDFSRAYDIDDQPVFSSGTPLHPGNVVIPSSAREEEILTDETIRSVALRLLGSAEFWKVLVLLNELKPPYISSQGGDGVLVPGVDKILVPQLANEGDITGVAESTFDTDASDALSPVVRKYGRDLRLSDGSTGTDFADVQVGQNGDLDLIDGIPNVNQAIMIKFSTEQGGLSLHPEFGAAFPIGSKVSLTQMQEFSLNTRATMLSDDRIEDVIQQRLFVEGDVLRVNLKAKLKQINATLPVDFTVRRI